MTNEVFSPARKRGGFDPYAKMLKRMNKSMTSASENIPDTTKDEEILSTTPGKMSLTPTATEKGISSPLVDVTNGATANTPSPNGNQRRSRKSPGGSRVSPRVPRRGLDSNSRETLQLRQLNALLLKRVSYQRDLQRTLEEMQASSERMRGDLRNQILRKDVSIEEHKAEIRTQSKQLKAYESQIAELRELLKSSKEETTCIRENADILQQELEQRDAALEESKRIAAQLEQKHEGTQKLMRLSFEKIKELQERQEAAELTVRNAAARAATFCEVLDKIVAGAQEQDARHAEALRRLSEEATAASEDSRQKLLQYAMEVDKLRDIIFTKDKVEWGLRKKLAVAKKGMATLSEEMGKQSKAASAQQEEAQKHIQSLRQEAASLQLQAQEAKDLAATNESAAKDHAKRADELDNLLRHRKEELQKAELLVEDLRRAAETQRLEIAEKVDIVTKKTAEAKIARQVIDSLKGDLAEAQKDAEARIAVLRSEVEDAERRYEEATLAVEKQEKEAKHWHQQTQMLESKIAEAETTLLKEREQAAASAALAKGEYEEALAAITAAKESAYQTALLESNNARQKNDELQLQLKAAKGECCLLKKKISKLTEEMANMEQMHENRSKDSALQLKKLREVKENEAARASERMELLNAEIIRLSSELDVSRKHQLETENLAAQLKSKVQEVEQGISLKSAEALIARNVATQLRSDFLALRNAHQLQLKELEQSNSLRSRALQEAAVSRSVISQLRTEYRKQEEGLAALQEELKTSRKEVKMTGEHMRGLQRKLKLKETALSRLQQAAKESAAAFSSLQGEAALTKEELQKSEEKCKVLSMQVAEHIAVCKSLTDNLSCLKSRESALLAQIHESNDKYEKISEEVCSVRDALEEQKLRNEQLRSNLLASKKDGATRIECVQKALDASRRAAHLLQQENDYLRQQKEELAVKSAREIEELVSSLQQATGARDAEASRASVACKEAKIARQVIEELRRRAKEEEEKAATSIGLLQQEISSMDAKRRETEEALKSAIDERDDALRRAEEYAQALETAHEDIEALKRQVEIGRQQLQEQEEIALKLRSDLSKTQEALEAADLSMEKMEHQNQARLHEKEHVIRKLKQELNDVRAEALQNSSRSKELERSLLTKLECCEQELSLTKASLAKEVTSREASDKNARSAVSQSQYLQCNVEELTQLVQAKEALIKSLKGELKEIVEQSSKLEDVAKSVETELRRKLQRANKELQQCRDILGKEKAARDNMENELKDSMEKARQLERQVQELSDEASTLRENLEDNQEDRLRLVQIEVNLDLARRKLREEREKNARMAVMLQEAEGRAQCALLKVSKALAKVKKTGSRTPKARQEVVNAKREAASAGFAAIMSVSTLVVMVTSAVTGMRY